jgi:branched-chain amino acid transport system substrate-binding protein
MKRARLIVLGCLCLGLVAIVAGCGGGGSSSSGGSTGESTGNGTTETTDSSSGIEPNTVEVGLKFTDGKEGAAEEALPPVTIGFVNQQGSTPSFPELEYSADAAVELINEKLGGVEGHPVKLDKCVIQAEEDGQKCAAQFLNDGVDIAIMSCAVFGNEAFYKTIDGKFPVIVSVAGVEADYNTPHVWELDAGGDGVLLTMAENIKKLGAKKVSIISSNNPAGKFITGEFLVPKLEELGAEPKAVYISDSATTPEYVSSLQAAGASEAEALMLVPVAPTGCISMYDAMQQLAIEKPVSTDFWCSGDPVPAKTGGGPTGWPIASLAENQLLVTPESEAFKNAMDTYGQEKWFNVGSTPKSFGDVLTVTKWANEIGYSKLSSPEYEKAIAAFRGPAFMVPGDIKCGAHPTYAGICGDTTPSSIFENGEWKSDGDNKVVTLK